MVYYNLLFNYEIIIIITIVIHTCVCFIIIQCKTEVLHNVVDGVNKEHINHHHIFPSVSVKIVCANNLLNQNTIFSRCLSILDK